MDLRQSPEGLLRELSLPTDRDIQPCLIAPLDMDIELTGLPTIDTVYFYGCTKARRHINVQD